MSLLKSNFSFQNILGEGTFSQVYAARRRTDWKPYTIKVQKLCDVNVKQLEMIQKELKILDTLRHPNIIAYYGSWEEQKHIYILMEFATRGTLKDLLDSRLLPLMEKDALYLFSQMVLGVRYIHSMGILHRDIKPENIMLTGRNGDIVKLGDFGLSKDVHDHSSCHAGSFNYMAPEIFQNFPCGFGSDIWSMGVVLYEMVTKRLPFPAETYNELMQKVCNEKPKPLDYPTSRIMVSLISKLLRKNLFRRATMRHLVLCPYLIPTIIQINLNVGRGMDYAKKDPTKFGVQLFEPFLSRLQSDQQNADSSKT